MTETDDKSQKPAEVKEQKLVTFNVDYTEYKTCLTRKYSTRKPYHPANPKKVLSFIPGTIKKIYVKEGDKIKAGDKLLILEAMKMKNDILSTINGKVKKIHIKQDENVSNKQLLIELQ